MSSKNTSKKVKISQKETQPDIETEIDEILAKLRLQLTDKKFKHRIKKAVKVLTHGLEKKKVNKTKVAKPSATVVKQKKAVALKKISKK